MHPCVTIDVRFIDLTFWGIKEAGHGINNVIASLTEASDLQGAMDQADFSDDVKPAKVCPTRQPSCRGFAACFYAAACMQQC